MVFPLSNYSLSRGINFFSFAVSLAFEPYTFEIRAVSINFSQIPIRMPIFKYTFLNPTIMPTFAANSMLFAYNWQRCPADLTIVIVNSKIFIILVKSLCNNLRVLNMSKSHPWQFSPFVDCQR